MRLDHLKRSLLLVVLLAILVLGTLTWSVQMTMAAATHPHTTVAPYCPPPPRFCSPSI